MVMRVAAVVVVAAGAAVGTVWAGDGVEAVKKAGVSRFSIIALPDTQFYCENPAWTWQFNAQTQWCVDEMTERQIAFVSHLGDIVQNGANGGNNAEWIRASTAMQTLNGFLAYSSVCGNHDYNTVSNKGSGSTSYNAFFGPSRYAGYAWYGGASSNQQNHYQLFSAGGFDFLHLTLEWQPDAAAMAWGQSVIDAHPGRAVVLSTHEFLQDADTTGAGAGKSGAGQTLWNEFVKLNPSIFMTMNGHFHRGTDGADGEYHQVKLNDAGLACYQMLSDYQAWANGGSGYLRWLQFDPRNGLIRVKTFSPTLGVFQTDYNSQFSFACDFGARISNVTNPPTPQLRTLRFQEGVNGYFGTSDTQLRQSSPTTPRGDETTINVDAEDGTNPGPTHGLVKFANLIGSGAGQIPAGSDVVLAKLRLTVTDAGSGFSMHRMLLPWSESSTWDSMTAGVDIIGIDALAAPDTFAGVGNGDSNVPLAVIELDVTASLRAYLNGAVNEGWGLLPWAGGANGMRFATSEAEDAATRPELVVTLPNGEVTTATFREGLNGYAGTSDVELRGADPAPGSADGAAVVLSVDSDDPSGSGSVAQALVKFEGLFGAGAGQVPSDAMISSAVLKLNVTDEGSGFRVHRMVDAWDETSTWSSMGAGVVADDAEAMIWSECAAGATDSAPRVRAGVVYLDVTETVQGWQAGDVNQGWVLVPLGVNGVDVSSSESATESARPMLVVRYVVPSVPPECAGDANGDLVVNGADLSVLLAQFGTSVTPGTGADFNGDGAVNGADLSVLLGVFGSAC